MANKTMQENILKERDLMICKLIAQGKPQEEVGKLVNISQERVSQISRKRENREIIEQESMRLLAHVPEIINQFSKNIEISKMLLDHLQSPKDCNNTTGLIEVKEMLDFLKLSYKQKSDMLRAVGLLPTQSQSVFIQQIYNDNRTQNLSSEVFKKLGSLFAENIEDVEFEEVDEEID